MNSHLQKREWKVVHWSSVTCPYPWMPSAANHRSPVQRSIGRSCVPGLWNQPLPIVSFFVLMMLLVQFNTWACSTQNWPQRCFMVASSGGIITGINGDAGGRSAIHAYMQPTFHTLGLGLVQHKVRHRELSPKKGCDLFECELISPTFILWNITLSPFSAHFVHTTQSAWWLSTTDPGFCLVFSSPCLRIQH